MILSVSFIGMNFQLKGITVLSWGFSKRVVYVMYRVCIHNKVHTRQRSKSDQRLARKMRTETNANSKAASVPSNQRHSLKI